MNLEHFALITNLFFLVGFAFADLRHKKDIPAYAFEPLLISYALFCGFIFLNLLTIVIMSENSVSNQMLFYFFVIMDTVILIVGDKLKYFGNGDKFILICAIFISPLNFFGLILLSVITSNGICALKKEKEIEFMPIWSLVNVIPLVVLLTT